MTRDRMVAVEARGGGDVVVWEEVGWAGMEATCPPCVCDTSEKYVESINAHEFSESRASDTVHGFDP